METDRESQRNRERNRKIERASETEKETVSQTGRDTDKAEETVRKRDAKKVSRVSEVRTPKETGANRVSPRKTDKETKKEDNQTQNPHRQRDKQTLRKSWKMERDEKGKQQRKPAQAYITPCCVLWQLHVWLVHVLECFCAYICLRPTVNSGTCLS